MSRDKREHEKEIVIRPPRGMSRLDISELFSYRHMLASMVRRNIKTDFEGMYLGVVWAVIRPTTLAIIFGLFRDISGTGANHTIPYMLYVYSGLVLWYYFTDATMQVAGSVKKDAAIIKKVYFPRLITPIVPVLSNLSNLAIATVPLILMMSWYGLWPGMSILLLPLVIIQCMCMVFGIGSLFAAFTIANRDLEQFLSFILYIGLFVSPILFWPDLLPVWAKWFVSVNPMTGTLLALRAVLFDGTAFPVAQWIYSCAFTAFIVLIGAYAYRYNEASIGDRL